MTRIRAFEYKYKQARIYSINEIGFTSKALVKKIHLKKRSKERQISVS